MGMYTAAAALNVVHGVRVGSQTRAQHRPEKEMQHSQNPDPMSKCWCSCVWGACGDDALLLLYNCCPVAEPSSLNWRQRAASSTACLLVLLYKTPQTLLDCKSTAVGHG